MGPSNLHSLSGPQSGPYQVAVDPVSAVLFSVLFCCVKPIQVQGKGRHGLGSNNKQNTAQTGVQSRSMVSPRLQKGLSQRV